MINGIFFLRKDGRKYLIEFSHIFLNLENEGDKMNAV